MFLAFVEVKRTKKGIRNKRRQKEKEDVLLVQHCKLTTLLLSAPSRWPVSRVSLKVGALVTLIVIAQCTYDVAALRWCHGIADAIRVESMRVRFPP